MASEAKQDSTFNAAKQLYAEQFGDAIVTNTYLKIALLVMALVAGGLIYTNIKTVRMVQNFKPLVIRINDIGRAEAVRYDTLGYKPQDAEIKYFLSDFCRMYYSRNHYTVRDNFKKSLLFMEAQLANSVAEAYRKNHTIENYLQDSSGPDIDIEVQKVSIRGFAVSSLQGDRGFLRDLLFAARSRRDQAHALYSALRLSL